MEQISTDLLIRIVDALERLAPPPPAAVDLMQADAFVWRPFAGHLAPVRKISRVDIRLLKGVDRQKTISCREHPALR